MKIELCRTRALVDQSASDVQKFPPKESVGLRRAERLCVRHIAVLSVGSEVRAFDMTSKHACATSVAHGPRSMPPAKTNSVY